MLAQIINETVEFTRPDIDWHAGAPELVILAWGALVTIVDLVGLDRVRRLMAPLTGIGFLLAMIPVLTLWSQGDDLPRTMFDGAYVVDNYSLVLKGLFLISGYVIVLLSSDYMADGDYYDSEFYQLIAASVLGMLVMTSARDLISIFIALELLSIPAYLLAAWRKRDLKSNEAGLKYMLMGVFASGILLYGMSAGSTARPPTPALSVIGETLAGGEASPLVILGVLFTVIGFGFKVSAVPFHTWAPDTYEGAPTPLTAFLAVASKAAGFVALMNVVFFAFNSPVTTRFRRAVHVDPGRRHHDRRQPDRSPSDQHRQDAGLFRNRSGRLRACAAGRLRGAAGRRPAGDGALPRDLRRHEPRCLRRGHHRRPQDPVGRDLVVRRDVPLRAGAHAGDDGVPVLAGRHPADGWLLGQVLRVQGA